MRGLIPDLRLIKPNARTLSVISRIEGRERVAFEMRVLGNNIRTFKLNFTPPSVEWVEVYFNGRRLLKGYKIEGTQFTLENPLSGRIDIVCDNDLDVEYQDWCEIPIKNMISYKDLTDAAYGTDKRDGPDILQRCTPVIITRPTAGFARLNLYRDTILYCPIKGYEGPDSITYAIMNDSGQLSEPKCINITVYLPGFPEKLPDPIPDPEYPRLSPTSGPGSNEVVAGTVSHGFYGEVENSVLFPAADLISLLEANEEIGPLDFGEDTSTSSWLKYAYEGKILFVAKKSFKSYVSWADLNRFGLVTGEAVVTYNGYEFKVRLLTGSNGEDPAEAGGEWDGMLYRSHETYPYSNYWARYSDKDLRIAEGNGSRTICQEAVLPIPEEEIPEEEIPEEEIPEEEIPEEEIPEEVPEIIPISYLTRGFGSVTGFEFLSGSTKPEIEFAWRPVLELIEYPPEEPEEEIPETEEPVDPPIDPNEPEEPETPVTV